MISNITNALPALLKKMQDREEVVNPNELTFSLVETIKFYQSILPKDKSMACLKHMFIDCEFVFNEKYAAALKDFTITLDTHPFLKNFDYDVNLEEGSLIIRSSYQELAIFSLVILGAVKNIVPEIDVKNKSIFVSLVYHFIKYCIENGYNVCEVEDLKMLEIFNAGFDTEALKAVKLMPTQEDSYGTIHFIGIDLNKDILVIFEKYNDVKFTYNQEDASFIISMRSSDWNDFWLNAPQYLKNEFVHQSKKDNLR